MFGFRNIYLCLRWFSFFLFALHRHISSRSCACCSWLWCFSRINFRNISFDCCGSSGTLKCNKIWFYYRPSSCQVKVQICYIHAKHPKKQMKDRKSLEEKKASTNFFHLEVLCNETGVRRDMSKLYASPLHLFFPHWLGVMMHAMLQMDGRRLWRNATTSRGMLSKELQCKEWKSLFFKKIKNKNPKRNSKAFQETPKANKVSGQSQVSTTPKNLMRLQGRKKEERKASRPWKIHPKSHGGSEDSEWH